MKSKEKLPVSYDSVDRYLVEIRRFPLLSKEEEYDLAVKYYKNKDTKTAHKLVTSNLHLVVKIAYDYLRSGYRIMDLIQEGNIGLMQAVKEFNPYKGAKLSTYAAWWIKAYIQNYLMKNWSLVKVGTTQAQRKLFYKLNCERKKLEALGIKPELRLLSANLGVKEEDITNMGERLDGRDISLSTPIDKEDGKTTLLDVYSQAANIPIDQTSEESELKEILAKHLDEFKTKLKGKELYVFEKRMISENPLTLQEIGDKHKITRERVRQIEEIVMKKLKEFFSKKF